jgi:hypothetical protein
MAFDNAISSESQPLRGSYRRSRGGCQISLSRPITESGNMMAKRWSTLPGTGRRLSHGGVGADHRQAAPTNGWARLASRYSTVGDRMAWLG